MTPSILVALRRQKGWSLRAAAEHLGCHHATLSRIERRRQLPSLVMICRIARAYGVHPVVVFDAVLDRALQELPPEAA